jgi:hypothetical protein
MIYLAAYAALATVGPAFTCYVVTLHKRAI